MAGYIGANTSSVTNNQNAAERRKKFTFTANTTVLSGLSFLPDKIHIFHNGIRLVKNTDFTEAADGQSVTLINAAQAGDEIVAVTFEQNPAVGGGSSYTDADVDAHLLTAGVTLDATNDRIGVGIAAPTAPIHIEAPDNTELMNFTVTGNEKWALKGASGVGADDYVSFGISGGNEAIRWHETGYVVKPNQPAFYMRNTTDAGRFKGGTVYVNKGNHWNNSTGVFTAPIAGAYQFGAFAQSNASAFYILAYHNGGAVGAWYDNAGSGYKHASLTLILDMAANDTLYIGNANINLSQNGIFGHFLG